MICFNFSSDLFPVALFLHYGGFYVLSARSDVVGPRYLMDRDMILVTCNFRLGSLGFLSTGDNLAPGNNGFKDQVVVLSWIQRNIAAFGGDPDNVSLLGCGSGAYSVALHMLSPMSKGLFHRAVSMSSSPFSQVRIDRDQFDLAAKQARLVDCPFNTSSAIIKCLRTKPWQEIGDSVNGFFELPTNRVLYWTVVIERDFGQERFMPYDPLDAVRSGNLYSVPYIIGQTRDEYSWLANIILNNATLTKMLDKEYTKYAPIAFMLPKGSTLQALTLRKKYLGLEPIRNDTTTLQNLGMMFGDALIGFSSHRLANIMCRYSKAPVYYYQFSYIGNNSFYENPVTKTPVGELFNYFICTY
ncbi:esterase FE4-like [Epargyreus clarus]|uniref:esterase FE4-like n=1 Tax=Epargyreus clarus TaxID=520877 RepID=UPI003C2ECFB3